MKAHIISREPVLAGMAGYQGAFLIRFSFIPSQAHLDRIPSRGMLISTTSHLWNFTVTCGITHLSRRHLQEAYAITGFRFYICPHIQLRSHNTQAIERHKLPKSTSFRGSFK